MLHFLDASAAAREALRVLVPAGRFAYTVWDRPDRPGAPIRGLDQDMRSLE